MQKRTEERLEWSISNRHHIEARLVQVCKEYKNCFLYIHKYYYWFTLPPHWLFSWTLTCVTWLTCFCYYYRYLRYYQHCSLCRQMPHSSRVPSPQHSFWLPQSLQELDDSMLPRYSKVFCAAIVILVLYYLLLLYFLHTNIVNNWF